jgi:hypothetical protein
VPEVVIAFTVSGQRENYLKRALESWSKVRGIESAGLVFCVEPARSFPLDDFRRWVSGTFPVAAVRPNPRVYGCLRNTKQAFDSAFHMGARLAVMAEEDLVVAADILEYLTWAAVQYEQDQSVTAVCCHVKESESRDDSLVVKVPWFNPLVCATWKDRWEGLWRPSWRPWEGGLDQNQAWDNNLRLVLARAKKTSVFPVQSRVMHIGEISTIYAPAIAEFMYKASVSDCFSRDYHVPGFREVPFAEVPGLLV